MEDYRSQWLISGNYGSLEARTNDNDAIYMFTANDESYTVRMIENSSSIMSSGDDDVDPSENINHTNGSCRGGSTHAKKHWATLKSAVFNGDFLVQHDATRSKSAHAREIQDEIRNGMELNLTTGGIAIVTYMLTAVVVFWLLGYRKWTLIDSCYFAVETFTTIGYGDLVPETPLGKLVTCIYGAAGVTTLGVFLGVIGHRLLVAQNETKKKEQERNEGEFLNRFFTQFSPLQLLGVQSGNDDDATIARSVPIDTGTSISATARPIVDWCGKEVLSIPYSRIILYIFILVLMSYLIGSCEGWTVMDTAYFGVITAFTIGFGDYAPVSQLGRLYAIFFMPLAVGATGFLLGQIADAIISRQQAKSTERFINRRHTVEELNAMDLGGDGMVTWADFLEFMLLTMDKVDKKLIEGLRANFDKMDLDRNGVITKEDLITRARQSVMKPENKLFLQAYKRQLTTDVDRGMSMV